MTASKGINDDGDLILIDGVRDCISSELKMHIRCMKLLDIIRVITDPAELPEYLIDEDIRVVERAATRLNQLVATRNG